MHRIRGALYKSGELIKGKDLFGTPVTLNYRGEATHKSILGGVMTIIAVFLLFISFILGLERLGSRDGPNISNSSQFVNRGPNDALSIPESHGQIYIGLKQK